MKKIAWGLVAVLIVAGLALVVVKRRREKNSAPTLKTLPIAVRAARVTSGRVYETRHVLGTVIGADESMVTPRIMAQVLAVKVREGDRVKKGQVLVLLDPREIRDAVDQAKSGLAAARVNAAAAHTAFLAQRDATARDKKLYKARAISKEQWDRSNAAEAAASARYQAAMAAVKVAKLRVDQAVTRLGYTRLKAPFDGVVSARLKDPGDLATPGRPVLKVVRSGAIRVRASLPANDFTALRVGMKVTVYDKQRSVNARVSRVFPAMGRSHLTTFEADLDRPPPGFVSGAPVGVDLHIAGAKGLKVPADALLEGAKGSFVFVVRAGRVHPTRVKVLGRSLDAAVIQGRGIQANDLVVTGRPSRLMTLFEGERAEVVGTVSASAQQGRAGQ